MATKLVQKSIFKGIQEFEIAGGEIHVRTKALFTQESRSTIALSTLSPDPMINNASMEFHSRDGHSPQLSLFLNKPSDAEFNAFVTLLRERVEEERNTFVGTSTEPQESGSPTQIHEEPPAFDDPNRAQSTPLPAVNGARVEEVIQMLERYLDREELAPLMAALEALQTEPESESNFAQLVDAFHQLGPSQGAVLTYAPYLSTLLADQMFRE